MKNEIISCILLIGIGFSTNAQDSEFKSVKIGDQIWMQENLNIPVDSSYCYDHKPENCEKYGRIYNWYGAMEVCPEGWHLPTDDEFQILVEYLGGQDLARDALKVGGSSGFEALMAGGIETEGSFLDLDQKAYFWTSTEIMEDYAWYYYLWLVDYEGYGETPIRLVYHKRGGASVRCLKDQIQEP